MVTRLLNGSIPLSRLRSEMEEVFGHLHEDFPHRAAGWLSPGGFPAMNVWEDGTCLYAEAEIPGLKLEDLDVTVIGSELCIKGERKVSDESGTTFHRRERGTGSFSRVIHLPVDIDGDQVEATLKNGILQVKLPKAAAAQPRKIEVQTINK